MVAGQGRPAPQANNASSTTPAGAGGRLGARAYFLGCDHEGGLGNADADRRARDNRRGAASDDARRHRLDPDNLIDRNRYHDPAGLSRYAGGCHG